MGIDGYDVIKPQLAPLPVEEPGKGPLLKQQLMQVYLQLYICVTCMIDLPSSLLMSFCRSYVSPINGYIILQFTSTREHD